jgi:hypothetical protein
MKTMTIALILCLTTATAFSAPSKTFFECRGLAGVEEYRIGIDLVQKKASFFDNDSTSMMKLTETKLLETDPPQTRMIFTGNEATYAGTLRLEFNLTKQTASLYSIDRSRKVSLVGSANCVNTTSRNL